MYEEPRVLGTFEAEEMLGDAHGFLSNGSTFEDPSDRLLLVGSTRPM